MSSKEDHYAPFAVTAVQPANHSQLRPFKLTSQASLVVPSIMGFYGYEASPMVVLVMNVKLYMKCCPSKNGVEN